MNTITSPRKAEFRALMKDLVQRLNDFISTDDHQWAVKGFIDVFSNVYTISADTKVVSKILEIHLLPLVLQFARDRGYRIVLAEHQNYYPDLSFVLESDETVKFAVDFKTTYRLPDKPGYCNGFTLGSHGGYFINRDTKKTFNFPIRIILGIFALVYSIPGPCQMLVMTREYTVLINFNP